MPDDDTHKKNRPLTLRDVSEASGVSEMTVSRVLRNRGDVSQKTRERVLEAAQELGYVPNKIAGSLASNRVNLVSVVIPSLSNLVFPRVLTGISEALEDTPLQPVIGVTDYKPEKEESVLYEMLSWRPSGVILAGLEHSEASRAMLRASGIPVVEIMDVDGKAVDSVVGISHRRAGREIARRIIKNGYRRIAFLGTKMPLDHRARKRFEGFTEVLAREGLETEATAFYDEGSSLTKGREMTQKILEEAPNLDFLYFSNDLIGAGGLLYCLEQGIDVPGRIGMAGFNAIDLIDGLPKKLATIDACRYEIGQKAAEIIVERTQNPDADDPQRIELDPILSLGDTLGPRTVFPEDEPF